MTRTSYRPIMALALVGGLLTYVGCSSRTDGPSNAPSTRVGTGAGARVGGESTSATPGNSSAKGGKPFEGWPTPAGALVISGEQFGYLEPCGCTQGQLGGLKRRYDLVERLREERKWPLVLLDLGSLIKDPAGARGGFEQSKLKFDVALKALALMKYDALALSPEDMKVGTDEAFVRFLNMPGEKTKVICANVVPVTGFEARLRPSLRTEAGPYRVGITAVLDPKVLRRAPDPARDALIPEVKPPEEALPGVLADLEKDTDIQVLMVQAAPELARALAEKFPGFDVVVGTSPFDPGQDAERLNDGKTMLVTVGPKGKYVAVVGLFRDQDPKGRLRYQRITLDHHYNGPAKPMRDLIEDEFQGMLKSSAVVETFPRRDYARGSPGARFVGVETCRSCHPNTVAKWATTRHARAFDDIVKDPKEERSDHQFDAECVSCHTTGFEYNSGWKSAELTPLLKGNQCENCHGPASKHVEAPKDQDARKAIALTAAEADRGGLCIRCHDEDNSPKFNFTTYWGQINHSGLDRYGDEAEKGKGEK